MDSDRYHQKEKTYAKAYSWTVRHTSQDNQAQRKGLQVIGWLRTNLLVTPSGGKLWRFQYRFNDKQKLLALGSYPAITLADARKRREDARKLLANGVDPSEIKKAQKTATVAENENSFEVIAREWHAKFTPTWAPAHAKTTIDRLTRDVFLFIGARPIAEIKAPELLAVLRRVESRGALETAHRVKTICGQVFRYAIATGRAERDIAADLKGAMPPAKKSHLAAVILSP